MGKSYSNGENYSKVGLATKELIQLKLALDQSVIVGITDVKGEIIYVNDMFCEVSKFPKEELLGQDHRILNSGYHSQAFFKEMWSTIAVGHIWRGEICNRNKEGNLYWVQTTIVPVLNEDGKPYQYISFRVDITEQKNMKQIEHMMNHDELTDLPNRRSLKNRLLNEIKMAEMNGTQFAVILMDINRFKAINDGFGYVMGDLFLIEVAHRLVNLSLGEDVVFHLGGDEFVILIDNCENVVSAIREISSIFKESFLIGEHELFANASIGISIYKSNGVHAEELLTNANVALNNSKNNRDQQYVFYHPNMNTSQQEILLETKLRQAIEKEQLQLYYQPKIDSMTNKMIGMEALLRWYDSEIGYISPNEFIPIAEQCGLINQIGDWVLYTAAKQTKILEEEYGISLRVAVNVSPVSFKESTFVDKVKATLHELNVNPQSIELEITENSMMTDTDKSIATLVQLKELGLTISIDDFGSGYSSFSYLKKFPIDALKIDQSFIRDLKPKSDDTQMVLAIIQLAHALKLHVVAEGVETEEAMRILKENKCDLIQGYYYSKPLSVEDFSKKIEEFL